MAEKSVGPVKILHGALDEGPGGEIVLRGVIAPESLLNLQRDDYQRESLPLTSLSNIVTAIKAGETLPDVELGMRGQDYTDRNGVFTLKEPVFIVDGLQRISGGIHVMQSSNGEVPVRIGATIHFGTNKEWERNRFRILNTLRVRVSPSVILRNMKDGSPFVNMLCNLTANDKSFVLLDRVTWSQRMNRSEIITGLTLAKTVGFLHAHIASTRSVTIEELVPGLDKAMEICGIQTMRANIRTFFDLIDECWGIRRIQYKEGSPHVKGAFLTMLAKLISDHRNFWQGDGSLDKKLFIEAPLRRKIGQFAIHDPQISNLAGSNGASRVMLYMLLRNHINSGKRTKHLIPRNGDHVEIDGAGDEEK